MLTREQMEQVIAGGGSVLLNGRIITQVEDLPAEKVRRSSERVPPEE